MSNSHIKFGMISSNVLGEDSIMDGRTDVGDYYIKKRGDYKLVYYCHLYKGGNYN